MTSPPPPWAKVDRLQYPLNMTRPRAKAPGSLSGLRRVHRRGDHRPVTFPPGTAGQRSPGNARLLPGGNAPAGLRQGVKQPNRFRVTETGSETFPAASTATTEKVFIPSTIPYSNTWV